AIVCFGWGWHTEASPVLSSAPVELLEDDELVLSAMPVVVLVLDELVVVAAGVSDPEPLPDPPSPATVGPHATSKAGSAIHRIAARIVARRHAAVTRARRDGSVRPNRPAGSPTRTRSRAAGRAPRARASRSTRMRGRRSRARARQRAPST